MSRAKNRHQILGGIGSYWGEHIHPDSAQLMRSLVHLPDAMDFQSFTEDLRASWVGASEVPKENIILTFDPDTVVVFGADQQARILETYFDAGVGATLTIIRKPMEYEILQGFAPLATEIDGYTITAEDCEYLVWPIATVETTTTDPNLLQNAWEVAIPYGLYPESILVGDDVLTAGIDFKVFPGALQFQENPYSMFPDRKMHAIQARQRVTNPMNHALNVDEFSGDAEPVSRFFREVSNGPSLRRAVAEISGMVTLSKSGILLDARPSCGATRYMFDWGVVNVPYAHETLEVSTWYEAGTIVGDLIRVHTPTGNAGRYAAVDWGETGLNMDTLCPVKGLHAQNHSVKFWAYSQTGDKLHVRAQLDGPPETLDTYWDFVKMGEIASGRFLNDVIGLSALNDSVQLNPIEFLFRTFLADRLIVVELRTRGIEGPMHERALSFLTEHRIVGSLLTVIES